MEHRTDRQDFDEVAIPLIRHKARQVVQRPEFRTCSREDIEQELALKCVEAARRFDPRRGQWDKFIASVVRRAATSMIRARLAAKRNCRREERSVNDMVSDGDGNHVALHETLASDHRRSPEKSHVEIVGRRLDLSHVLSSLSDEDRSFAERLKHGCTAEVARRVNVPRTTVNDKKRRFRKRFEDDNLQDYL